MKDRIKSKNVSIRYCPTEQMLADFITKPLQGSLFKHFKRVIMGLDHISTLWKSELSPTEERVEKSVESVLRSSLRKPDSMQRSRLVISFGNNP